VLAASARPHGWANSIADLLVDRDFGVNRDLELKAQCKTDFAFQTACFSRAVQFTAQRGSVPKHGRKALASVEVQRRGRLSDRKWHILGGALAALATGIVAWVLRGLLGI
jgi:hypothetical protein